MRSFSRSAPSALVLLTLFCPSLLGAGPNHSATSSAPSDLSELKQLESRASDAIRKALPAIVAVNIARPAVVATKAPDHVLQSASGVLISRDGLILSQWHVSHTSHETGKKSVLLAPGEKIEIALQDGRRLQAELLGADPVRDLSLLRITEPGVYPFLELAKPNAVARGDKVIKLGHPYGYRASRGATARLGTVLYTGESIEIVADCLTFAGDSGGPLINLDGQLIGIIENGSAPQLVIWSLPDRCGNPTCYSSTDTIARLMPAMLHPPRGATRPAPDFDEGNLPEHKAMMAQRRKELYGDTDAKILPAKDWTQGEQTRSKWKELTAKYQGSVVQVLGRHRPVAFGTVVGDDGWILTKASEIPDDPKCKLPNDQVVPAKVIGTDAATDLALLKIEAKGLRAVEWSTEKVRPAGKLLASPDGRGGSIGVGIVSVQQRALEGPFPTTITRAREYSPKPLPQIVLGKMVAGKGLLVRRVKDSAAAAGIVPGDLLLSLNDQPIRDADDVDKFIAKSAPGDILSIAVERAGKRSTISIKLSEDVYIRCPDATAWYRNARADDFPEVFEHDIPLLLDECGGPVIDLEGKTVGITIARVAQHGCMALPADLVVKVVARLKR